MIDSKLVYLFFFIHITLLLPAQSIETLREGAQNGNLEAMNDLAFVYEKGTGVAQNTAESIKWYKKAAQSGYAAAQSNLGNCYLAGRGLPKDTVEAVKWYLKAAQQHYAKAQYNLGTLYDKGWGKQPQDLQKSTEWYQKAAENGNIKAMNNLAIAHMEGEGVVKDLQKAFFWSEKAAKGGFAAAQLLVGQLYLTGNGVAQNRIKAHYWLKRAVLQGVPEAALPLQQAAPETKTEMMAKIADDLCEKFTGPAMVESAQRPFTRFHFFAKQVFDPLYPDFKQLMAYAPRDKAPDLQKNILIQTFQQCPTFGEKYGYDGDESPFYARLTAPVCDCVTKRYEKSATKKATFQDTVWRKMYEECIEQLVQKDSFFNAELAKAVLDFAQRKNLSTKKAAEIFARQLNGYFYRGCPFIPQQYAQIVVDVHNDSHYETFVFAPERMKKVDEILDFLKKNQKEGLKIRFKTESHFQKSQKSIDGLIKIVQKQPHLVPLLVQQSMTMVGMEETFLLANPKDKTFSSLLKLTFDKQKAMDALLTIESIAKKDISKQDLEKFQQTLREMSLTR